MYYINYFFVFSLIGHFIESFFYNSGSESGILYGPYTPIYGLGVCFILFVFHYLKKKNISVLLTVICLFLFGFIGLSLLELLGGLLIEHFFHVIFWDYSHMKFSIGHYISLEVGLVWGFSSVIVAYLIRPFFDKWITKIPKVVTWIFLIVFTVDCFITLFRKILF